jgi:hypothetical protein
MKARPCERKSGVRLPIRVRTFSLHQNVQNGSRAQTASCLMGVTRPGREADHSLPSSAADKNVFIYTSTPSIGLHDVHTNYFSLTFYQVLLEEISPNQTFVMKTNIRI